MALQGTRLKQIQLHPSGCQVWNRHVLAASLDGRAIAYASTLAIYVYDISSRPVRLLKVMAGHTKTITCLCWSPHDPSLLVSGDISGRLFQWTLAEDQGESGSLLGEHEGRSIVHADWDPIRPPYVAIADTHGLVSVWVVSNGGVDARRRTRSEGPRGRSGRSSREATR